MATTTAIYLFVLPRIDLIKEQAARLKDMAAAAGRSPTIVPIHSRVPGVKRGVVRALREAIDNAVEAHTVIITTHAAAMELYPDELQGLNVRWDELPEAATPSGSIGLATSWPAMRARYALTPGDEPGWFRVNLRSGAEPISLDQIREDVGGAKLIEFHRLAGSGSRVVEVDVAAWEDAGVPKAPPVRWRSVWSLAALRLAATVKVAAAGYPGSLADHAMRRAGGVRVEAVHVGGPRTGQPQIRIYYYTQHPGSTGWWEKKEGRSCLVAISRHLEGIGFDGYWASNYDIVPFFTCRIGGDETSPKLAGTNSLRHHTSCALIYSAKATPDDEAIIRALGLNREDIQAAREDEDVFQFACRGAIRDPNYSGDYAVYLYDHGQAERLRNRLIGAGYTDVVTEPVVMAGILDVVRPHHSRVGKRISATATETAAKRDARLKAQDAQRKRDSRSALKEVKIANGTYKGRGRPKGSSQPST
ncbi:hypothetical protein [Methylobacterium sp. NEAU K]|uniref:hypothetical protein n=1 Tax=Methylobacterium sp. NEAU K TaxID=3064946 RepID=UPI0027338CF4|nr:hypothetical protein [Methylobacterium sp. NEAU K]MDP4006719.1 hypothetical protein [Methylobacterium sp. NEAU K]